MLKCSCVHTLSYFFMYGSFATIGHVMYCDLLYRQIVGKVFIINIIINILLKQVKWKELHNSWTLSHVIILLITLTCTTLELTKPSSSLKLTKQNLQRELQILSSDAAVTLGVDKSLCYWKMWYFSSSFFWRGDLGLKETSPTSSVVTSLYFRFPVSLKSGFLFFVSLCTYKHYAFRKVKGILNRH